MRAFNFVEETTTSIAGTGGNGAVTLSAISGMPRFSTVLGTAARMVRYIIEDTVNKKFESGIGSVASNVLTRSKPLTTWDGSTYADGSAGTVAPLAFGSSPSTGDIIIRMGALAEAQAPVVPVQQSSIAGDNDWRDFPISDHIDWFGNGAQCDMVADREYYAYLRVSKAGVLKGVQFECTTNVSGSNVKLALYDIGHDGLPENKLVTFNTLATATTGIKRDTTTSTWSPASPLFLTPGWYVVGFIPSHAIKMRSSSSGRQTTRTPLGRRDGYGDSDLLYASGSYSTGLPATPAPTNMGSVGNFNSNLWIGLKVES